MDPACAEWRFPSSCACRERLAPLDGSAWLALPLPVRRRRQASGVRGRYMDDGCGRLDRLDTGRQAAQISPWGEFDIGRKNAEDCVAAAVKREGAPDDGGIGTEMALPETMRQKRCGCAVWLVVFS